MTLYIIGVFVACGFVLYRDKDEKTTFKGECKAILFVTVWPISLGFALGYLLKDKAGK